jgi:putative transposase
MKRRRHTPEQIIRKLREADRLLAEGQEIPEVAKQLEISEATYHRWRAQYGGLKAEDVKRLKELETENARLKRIVADKELQIEALRELGRGTGEPGPPAPRRGAPATGVRRLAAVGVPAGRAAPQHPSPPAGRAGSGPGPPRATAAAQPSPSSLGLSPRSCRAVRAGLEGEP